MFLRQCHRGAPFLFYNGNTFADIGRRLTAALFADLPTGRLRQATSAVAHYVAGVLDWESMSAIIHGLMESADLTPGSRVMTLRGSARGVVVRAARRSGGLAHRVGRGPDRLAGVAAEM